MRALGREVHVVAGRQLYQDPNAALPSAEVASGVKIVRIWSTRFGRDHLLGRAFDYLTFYLFAGWRLLRLTTRGDIVIAKTDPPLISIIAAAAARLRKARLVNWVQDVFPETAMALGVQGTGGLAGWLLQHLRDMSLRNAAMNIAVGDKMAEYLISRVGGHERVRTIHNWADDEAIVPLPVERSVLRKRWGLERKFVVGYSGNIGRVHEFATILETAERLRQDTDIVFLFIGAGNQKTYLESEAAKRALSQIVFKPYQTREILPDSLAVADVHLVSLKPELEQFVLPSKFYGIAAAGRPLIFIGDPRGEIATIVRAARCGAAVSPRESHELARVVGELRDDERLKLDWGANARRLLEEKYSRQRALKLWDSVLLLLDSASG